VPDAPPEHGVACRDGDLDDGIVIHELAHGLSSRLTGGSDNTGRLGWGESSGLGGVDHEYPMGA
jgi:hypothetical protein